METSGLYALTAIEESLTNPFNFHCTVKPRALIKYLVNLIMPPSPAAVLLDPFGGSGTAAIACEELGRDYVVIEREPEYVAIIRERIEATRSERGAAVQLPLDFGVE